jgi:hypothetical protein
MVGLIIITMVSLVVTDVEDTMDLEDLAIKDQEVRFIQDQVVLATRDLVDPATQVQVVMDQDAIQGVLRRLRN